MLNNTTYYENTTLSTTENSFVEEPIRVLERKFTEFNLETLTSEKDALLEKLIKLIEEIIEENKLNLAEEDKDSNSIANEETEKAEEKSETEFFKKLFCLEEMPKISVSKYIYRLNKFLNPEISSIIISFIYLDKLTSMQSLKLKICENNIYKLITTSLNVAIKYNEDDSDDNIFVAKVGGLTLQQLNELELNFCAKLKWEMFISNEVFKKNCENLSN